MNKKVIIFLARLIRWLIQISTGTMDYKSKKILNNIIKGDFSDFDEEKDIVEVVRCKDCKHWESGKFGLGCYWDPSYPNQGDDFCSHGEKEE